MVWKQTVLTVISIHAPHTGRDLTRLTHGRIWSPFQSTRPIRGATAGVGNNRHEDNDFNPRAPYGARQQKCIIYVLHFCNNRQSKHKNQQETSSVRTFFLINPGTQLAKVGANLPDAFCSLLLRTRSSVCPLADTIACSRNARSSFHTASLNSKIADYPAGDP